MTGANLGRIYWSVHRGWRDVLCSEHRSMFGGSQADTLGTSSRPSSAPSPGSARWAGWSPCLAGAQTLTRDSRRYYYQETRVSKLWAQGWHYRWQSLPSWLLLFCQSPPQFTSLNQGDSRKKQLEIRLQGMGPLRDWRPHGNIETDFLLILNFIFTWTFLEFN